jgi:4-phytase/acid phosphatase
MPRTFVAVLLTAGALTLAAGAVDAAPRLERVVVVMRHGVRPPTQANADLAKFADRPWPAWPVGPGELTPHGGQTVALTGATLRAAYVARGLLPSRGCSAPGQVSVWADGTDQRTRRTGEILAMSLEPGCSVPAAWAAPQPRDPIFSIAVGEACKVDPGHAYAPSPPAPAELARLKASSENLQAIIAPTACNDGPGTCFARQPDANGLFPNAAGLAEDILLEYADAKPMGEVGWGRASRADLDTIMETHEAAFGRIRDNVYASARRGAAMTRVVMGALKGEAVDGGPRSGPTLKLLGLAGHDTNLVLMASTFGLAWTLPGQPDSTAPSTALAFELWRDGHRRYVRAVLYYETLDQLRALKPALARTYPLRFKDCASGPMGGCPLEAVEKRVEAVVPKDCGYGPAAPPPGAMG